MQRLVKLLFAGVGATVVTTLATRAYLRSQRWFEWQGRKVIITGGSRGLGFVLAKQLVDLGADVAICARTQQQLDRAERDLKDRGGCVFAMNCDVTDRESVEKFVQRAHGYLGGIDVLINNAGIIEVGPWEAMTDEDFKRSMATHAWGTLNTIRAVYPVMRAAGWGRILNIASIGGKRAVPHMVPYAASKFALVGLSTGLRTELAQYGILVTTVSPGLMRTGSPRNAMFKSQHEKEYAWFSISDSLPLISLDVELAAERILRACQRGEAEATIAGALNISAAVSRLAPNLSAEVLALANRVLPAFGGIGARRARGFESQSEWSPSVLTHLSEQAAVENNEM